MESSAPGQGGPERAKVLIDELSDAIDVQYGGGAKLIVLGGVGTEEGKENVHKLWPKVHG